MTLGQFDDHLGAVVGQPMELSPSPAVWPGDSSTEDESFTRRSAVGKEGSLPPMLAFTKGAGMMSEKSFCLGSRHNHGSSAMSLLVSHFGFSAIRPDTFSGIQRHRKQAFAVSTGNDGLVRELEQHAHKQILACQNMGFTHRGSRMAESVLSLKQTVSPSAVHPSPIVARHAPPGGYDKGMPGSSRCGTPGAGGQRVVGRRAPNPGTGGKLRVPRLLLTNRPDDRLASRKSTLPAVNGNSLQLLLTQSNGK